MPTAVLAHVVFSPVAQLVQFSMQLELRRLGKLSKRSVTASLTPLTALVHLHV
jgi:hypothetical protein